jgi:hypothetical protein
MNTAIEFKALILSGNYDTRNWLGGEVDEYNFDMADYEDLVEAIEDVSAQDLADFIINMFCTLWEAENPETED